MIGTFPGKLALVEGDEVDVDLEIAGGRLRLTTGVSEIGAWPLDACLVTALPSGGYELTLDGERVAFSPDHPDAFSAVVARMTPVEPTAPTTGYDLEAALDQVLGGNASYQVPGLVEESAAEIAVTLEALFATAYPEYDLEGEMDAEMDAEVGGEVMADGDGHPAPESVLEPGASKSASPIFVDDAVVNHPDPAPSRDAVTPSPAASTDAHPDIWSGSPESSVQEEDAQGEEPMVDVSGWVGEDHDVPVWSPTPAAEDADVVADPVPIESLPADRSALGARWRPGAVEAEEADEIDEMSDDTLDATAEGVGIDPSDDEAQDAGFPTSRRVSDPLEGAVAAPVETSLDQEIDDETDVETDDEIDGEDGIGGEGGQRPFRGRGGGFGRGGSPDDWRERSAARGPDFGGDGIHPDRGFTRDSEFDLEGAAASAGHSMPGDDVEMQGAVERIPARRGMGGIFSKSAGERFSAVAGAIRDQADLDEEEESVSVADQILASQEQLRSGSKVVRFTPALVKKITVGLIIVSIVAGFVLITPTVIGFVVDRVQTEAEAASPSTTVPGSDSTVASAPSTTTPQNQTTTGGLEVVDARPVFELDSAGFVDRWNDTGSQVTERLVIGEAPPVGAFGLGFTRYLGLEGVVGESGLVESYTVVIDPLGDPADDQLGIQAFGVAINVAEPEATGPELSSILLDMGLDVGNPVVEGLGGSTSRNGVTYALEYDTQRQLIRLTVTSADAGTQPDTPTP